MDKIIIGVVGLGYVGLPIAVEFGKKFRTIGVDLSQEKIDCLKRFEDPACELDSDSIRSSTMLEFSTDETLLKHADFLVVAVPTPVNEARQPDFGPLISASEAIGRNLKSGATVVFESTVYPGATEEICIPVIEKSSGLTWGKDFNVAYSPERVNPGDKERTLTKITKIVSGDCQETLEKVSDLYGTIIEAGIHRVSSIKVAEAAKVIENTQRDLNIALMNELSIIFGKLGIDTLEVLEAAGSKWNFLPFRPGLVGGHCIGVDPYYLTYKAQSIGYTPEVILAGRRINDSMAHRIAHNVVKKMLQNGQAVTGTNLLICGLTFKENCADLRNSKVVDLISSLKEYGINVFVHDPVANASEAMHEYGIELVDWNEIPQVSAQIIAVAHRDYKNMNFGNLTSNLKKGGIFVDVKSVFSTELVKLAGFSNWRL